MLSKHQLHTIKNVHKEDIIFKQTYLCILYKNNCKINIDYNEKFIDIYHKAIELYSDYKSIDLSTYTTKTVKLFNISSTDEVYSFYPPGSNWKKFKVYLQPVENIFYSTIDDIIVLNFLYDDIFLQYFEKSIIKYNKIKTTKENKMKVKNIAERTAQRNTAAIKTAALIEVGNVANKQLTTLIKPHLPMMIRGYTDHPLFAIIIANIFGTIIIESSSNKKAKIIADAMLASATVDLTKSFNINEMINSFISKIDTSIIEEKDD
jgi:hypothetical protein